jgi:hypothetical protein
MLALIAERKHDATFAFWWRRTGRARVGRALAVIARAEEEGDANE